VDDPFTYACVQGECGAQCDQASDYLVTDSTCNYNCDSEESCGYQSQCSLQKFCEGSVRKYNGTCSGTGCSFLQEDCDGRDSYDQFVQYCANNTIRKHRLFHDWSCSGGDCVESTYYVDDQLVQNCTVNLCNGEVRNYNGTCNPDTVTCQYQTEDCNGLDGTYCHDSSTLEDRNYFCTPSKCDYVVTEDESCGTDQWTGGSNTPGFGADPSCIYTDYFCTGAGPNSFCSSSVTQDEDFDNLDDPDACNGIFMGKHDYWCSLPTCDSIFPQNGCSPGDTWYDLVCSQQCGAECDQNSDCSSFCSVGNVLNFGGTCDLASSCECSYQTKDCDDFDDDFPAGFHCDPGIGDIFNYYEDWACFENTGAECGYTGFNLKDGLKQDCNDTCTDTDGGINFTVKGTVNDNDLCTDLQTACPFNSYTDSCDGSILMEYYCSGTNKTSSTKNCNDYDCTTPVPLICDGIGTSTIKETGDDYGCSVGACAKAGTKTCTGPWTCGPENLCEEQPCGSLNPTCFYSSGFQWGTPPLTEGNCSDGYDNDCDGLIDCADPDCTGKPGPGGEICCQVKSDCNSFDLPPIGTCDYVPDSYHPTWDSTPGVPSLCISHTCSHPAYGPIIHTCNDNDLGDGIAFGSGCGAQCDQKVDCPPFISDSMCHFGKDCNSTCLCTPGLEEFCPIPGTVIGSTCYYGERTCTDEGCGIQNCTLQPHQICDPTEGCRNVPCNTIPPITLFSDGSSSELELFGAGGGNNSTAKVIIPANFNATGARVNITGIPLSFTGEKKVDIVVINDISGSMDDNCGPDGIAQPGETPCKINDMKNATIQFMNAMLAPPDNKMGLSSYNTKSINSVALTRNTTALTNEVNSYQASGFTCISCGILNGTNTVRVGTNPVKALLLMTDGIANRCIPGVQCNEPVAKAEAVAKAADAWNLYGIKIYAVAFGADADIVTMQQIADASHGKLYIANETNITDVYNQIAIEITQSFITNASLDVGANGIKEWTHAGIFNTTEMAFGWHFPELMNLLNGCNCTGCSLNIGTGECTIDLKMHSDSAGKILLDNLSIEGCVYQPEEVRCETCQECGGGEDCKDLGPWSSLSCDWSDLCDQSADCTRTRSVTEYICHNPGSVSSYCSASGYTEQENSTGNRNTEGLACDDGLFCTVSDACSSGTCTGQARTCNDGKECTDDSCNEQTDMCNYVDDNSNVCGAFRDCPQNQCIGLNWTTYPEDGHDFCSAGACQLYSCQAISSEPNEICESDSDGDGTPDNRDACPGEFGQDCNGCLDPCTGCAEMQCDEEDPWPAPICFADDSKCPLIACPPDGCGIGGCLPDQLADYPESVNKMCTLEGDDGICVGIACYPDCTDSELCPEGCEIETFGITVKTDKSIYNPEDTVTISGEVLDELCEPVIDGDVAIQVSNSTGPVFISQVSTNGSGFYTTAFILPPDIPLDLYNVFAVYDSVSNITSFTVAAAQGDSDGDGVLDPQDACLHVYGTACNGCPNPCTGCAQMVCTDGLAPTCAANSSKCSATICAADGCGLDGCSPTEMADYPPSVPNTCALAGTNGTCTQNACVPVCTQSGLCVHANHVVFSEVMYDPPAPEFSDGKEWLELYNPTGSDVNLGGLAIYNKDAGWTIPAGITIKAGGYVIVARSATGFYNLYGCYPTVDGFTRPLTNDGDVLRLKNGSTEIDMVAWKDFIPGWSLQAIENKTISRVPAWVDTDTPADWQNNTDPTPNPCLHVKQFTKNLRSGWNLISIPVNMTNRTIENATSSIAGKFTMIKAYDAATANWSTYDPAHPELSGFHDILPEKGYWINMTEDATLNVTGMDMASTQIPVFAGWNMIGYPTFAVQNVSPALSSVLGNYTLVRTYDPVAGWMTYDPVHPEFSDLFQLSPGYGYWIDMTVAETIVI
jgi:hypothetical protein